MRERKLTPELAYFVACERVETHEPYGGVTIHRTLGGIILADVPSRVAFVAAAAFRHGDGGSHHFVMRLERPKPARSGVVFEAMVTLAPEITRMEAPVEVGADGPGEWSVVAFLDSRRVGTLRINVEVSPGPSAIQ